jgi:hypothetical protein
MIGAKVSASDAARVAGFDLFETVTRRMGCALIRLFSFDGLSLAHPRVVVRSSLGRFGWCRSGVGRRGNLHGRNIVAGARKLGRQRLRLDGHRGSLPVCRNKERQRPRCVRHIEASAAINEA